METCYNGDCFSILSWTALTENISAQYKNNMKWALLALFPTRSHFLACSGKKTMLDVIRRQQTQPLLDTLCLLDKHAVSGVEAYDLHKWFSSNLFRYTEPQSGALLSNHISKNYKFNKISYWGWWWKSYCFWLQLKTTTLVGIWSFSNSIANSYSHKLSLKGYYDSGV